MRSSGYCTIEIEELDVGEGRILNLTVNGYGDFSTEALNTTDGHPPQYETILDEAYYEIEQAELFDADGNELPCKVTKNYKNVEYLGAPLLTEVMIANILDDVSEKLEPEE